MNITDQRDLSDPPSLPPSLPVSLPGTGDDQSDPELQQDGRGAAAVRGAAPASLESGCRERAAEPERRPAGPTREQQGEQLMRSFGSFNDYVLPCSASNHVVSILARTHDATDQ